ncbi:MAG: YybH family protein [Burkholderiales bacterium]
MKKSVFPTPQDAEEAFYTAFERASLDDMMEVWADDETILCIHPMGPMLQGTPAVQESWRQLFNGAAALRFHISDPQYFRDGLLSVHIVRENIYVGDDTKPQPPILATNVYQLTEQGWRMVLHHASPSSPVATTAPETKPSVLH